MLFALVVFAQDFAIRVHFDAPLFAAFVDDDLVVGAFLFPADDFSALGFGLARFLHRRRNVGGADAFLFVFFFFHLRGRTECECRTHYRCKKQLTSSHIDLLCWCLLCSPPADKTQPKCKRKYYLQYLLH